VNTNLDLFFLLSYLRLNYSRLLLSCSGIAGSPAELGVDNTNTWHVPVDAQNDAFPSLEDYFANPLATKGGFRGIPAFITFPGVKDKEWSQAHPDRTSCQMLMMAEHKWFAEMQQAAAAAQSSVGGGAPQRSEAYLALKEQWKQSALEILFIPYIHVCRCTFLRGMLIGMCASYYCQRTYNASLL
jgi:hypothetical protein